MLPGAALTDVFYALPVKLPELRVGEAIKTLQAANVYNVVHGKGRVHPSAWIRIEPTEAIPTGPYGMLSILLSRDPLKIFSAVILLVAVPVVDLVRQSRKWIFNKVNRHQSMNGTCVPFILLPKANGRIPSGWIDRNSQSAPIPLRSFRAAANPLAAFDYTAVANSVVGEIQNQSVLHKPHNNIRQGK